MVKFVCGLAKILYIIAYILATESPASFNWSTLGPYQLYSKWSVFADLITLYDHTCVTDLNKYVNMSFNRERQTP